MVKRMAIAELDIQALKVLVEDLASRLSKLEVEWNAPMSFDFFPGLDHHDALPDEDDAAVAKEIEQVIAQPEKLLVPDQCQDIADGTDG